MRLHTLMIVALLACGIASPVFAADAPLAWGDWLKPWWDMATQGVIAAVITLVVAGAKRWFRIDLEARHREALHMALTTGADAAWAKLTSWAGERLSREQVEHRLIAETIGHAQAGAADAIAAFKLDDADPRLINLAIAKLKQTAPPDAAAFSPPPLPAAIAA